MPERSVPPAKQLGENAPSKPISAQKKAGGYYPRLFLLPLRESLKGLLVQISFLTSPSGTSGHENHGSHCACPALMGLELYL